VTELVATIVGAPWAIPPVVVSFDRLATRLLYVEDDDDLRGMISGMFADAGFDVTSSPTAEHALEQLQTGQYDVIVTDFNLTGATGGWLLETAASRGYLGRTAAIVLSSELHPPDLGAYRQLRKPVDFALLLSAIEDAVGLVLPPVPVMTVGSVRRAEVELVLYVTSTSEESRKAIRNLHRALSAFDRDRIHLDIVDVSRGGDDALYDALEQDRVIVTPTLVRRKPGPKSWIVGTLAPIGAVEDMLSAALGAPSTTPRLASRRR
jgi:CheY-like chemotaxis protein